MTLSSGRCQQMTGHPGACWVSTQGSVFVRARAVTFSELRNAAAAVDVLPMRHWVLFMSTLKCACWSFGGGAGSYSSRAVAASCTGSSGCWRRHHSCTAHLETWACYPCISSVWFLAYVLLLQGPSGSSRGASRTLYASRAGTTSGLSPPAHLAPAVPRILSVTMAMWLALTAPANLSPR